MTWLAKHISVPIHRAPPQVYAFASQPANLPKWAAGLGTTLQNAGGEWIAEGPMGRIRVRFVAENPYGVLDHEVTLPSGERVHNPMRVLPNDSGSEIVFTLFRRTGVSEDAFEADARAVERDLRALKRLLES